MSADDDEELPFPGDDFGCFGCSRANPDGMGLRFRRRGDSIWGRYTIPERYRGFPGVAHGGIVSLILDEYSCAAPAYLRGTTVLTGELTVRFERPCPVEEEIEISARVTDDSHPRFLVIAAEIRRAGELVARSTGRFFPFSPR